MSTLQTSTGKDKNKILKSSFFSDSVYLGLCLISIISNIYPNSLLYYGYLPFILWLILKKEFSIIPLFLIAFFSISSIFFKWRLIYPLNTSIIPIILSFLIMKKNDVKQIFVNNKFIKYFYFESLGAIILTSIVLFLWYGVYGSNLTIFFKDFSSLSILKVSSFILLFAFINAIIEEVAFRGIVQSILVKKFAYLKTYGLILAILLQGFWFGAMHYQNGFPCYISGFFLASLYGVFLGLLKHRTQNLYLCILTHIFADITICILLIFF